MIPWIGFLALIGLLLVIVEFLIPGFGVFGVLGTVALLSSTIMIANAYGTGAFLCAVLILLLLAALFVYEMRKKKLYNKFILSDKLQAKGFDESTINGLLGKQGITATQLRPFGKAVFDEVQVDVVSEGDLIDRDCNVVVTKIEGKNVVVKKFV